MGKKKPLPQDVEQITKTAKGRLDGDTIKSIDLGELSLTMPDPGPTPENFADSFFRANAGSLRRLMVPYYRVVVVYPQREYSYGLDRWVKLMDGALEQNQNGGGRKQPIRKTAKA